MAYNQPVTLSDHPSDHTPIAVPRPRIGLSSCLLGQEVRYDGGHKHNAYITRTLGQHFDFVPFCPEVAIGLSTPRPSMRLQAADHKSSEIHAVVSDDASQDFTTKLNDFGSKVTSGLDGYSGYILKKDSPSCGMERVRVYSPDPNSPPMRRGSGIFATRLLADRPELPVEEEGRLMDPGLRNNFITRVFTLFRWHQAMAEGITSAKLVDFHTRHKFLILAHHEVTYRRLGQLVAQAGQPGLEALARQYLLELMTGLKHQATPGKHANVLMHIMGFIKDDLSTADKDELLGLIEAHQAGLVPIIVPITLLNHFLRQHPCEYVEKQYFLEPNPRELMLRNYM